jgi:hypothetical protein
MIALGVALSLAMGVWVWRMAARETMPTAMTQFNEAAAAFEFVSKDGKVRRKLTMQEARGLTQNEKGEWIDPESGAVGVRTRLAGDSITTP